MHRLFRITGLAEALSFLYLLLIAMPQKYMHGDLHATMVPGSIHGFLFIAYNVLALILSDREDWPRKKLIAAMAGSVVPFGTLVFDFRYLRRG